CRVVGAGVASQERPQAVRALADLPDERGRHEPWARLDGHAHEEPGVGGVRLLRDRAGLAGFGLAADRAEEHTLAVHRDLEVVLVLEPANRLEIRARQRDVKLIVAVERKPVAHADAADRAERKAFEVLAL